MSSEGQNTPSGSGAARGGVPRRAGARDQAMAVYLISVAAELAGVHPQTLRIYERRGLLDPARARGGARRDSHADIVMLRHIQELTASGLNIEGVRRVLALETQLVQLK